MNQQINRLIISSTIIFSLHILMIVFLNMTQYFYKHPQIYSPEKNVKINLIRSFPTPSVDKVQKKPTANDLNSKTIKKKEKEIEDIDTTRNLAPQKIIDSGTQKASTLNLYLKEIFKKIENNKYYPQIEKRNIHEGSIIIGFIINKDGSLKKSIILNKCSYSRLNKSALQTIQNSAPFPPIPEVLQEKELNINIEIVYELK